MVVLGIVEKYGLKQIITVCGKDRFTNIVQYFEKTVPVWPKNTMKMI